MDSQHRFVVGDALHVQERSIIPVMEAHIVQNKDAILGFGSPYALLVIDTDDLIIYSFKRGLTVKKIFSEVPELRDKLEKELEGRSTSA
ncbi:MAG TPA: hypothetical protein VE134_08140 [Methanomicrobiales archaeon]|nr:hypothetical protein [Methanomicrobiales archaeon]